MFLLHPRVLQFYLDLLLLTLPDVPDLERVHALVIGLRQLLLLDLHDVLGLFHLMDEGVSQLLYGGFVLLLFHLYLLNLFLGQRLLLVQPGQLLVLCHDFLLHPVDGVCEALYFLIRDAQELGLLVQICLQLGHLAGKIDIPFPLLFDLLRDLADLLLHLLEGLLLLKQQLQVGQIIALDLIPHPNLEVLKC